MSNYELVSLIIQSVGMSIGALIAIRAAGFKHTIEQLEKNTNSIKDALVLATGEKAHAEGVLAGKAEVLDTVAKVDVTMKKKDG